MTCSEFLTRFSEYRDGRMDRGERARARAHLDRCASCRRYRAVVERGVDLLRSMPTVGVTDDFRPRLRHRLYHLADEDALEGGSSSSGVTVAAAVGMAVLLALVAWSPVLQGPEPEVTLPPIVVSQAPRARAPLRVPASTFFTSRGWPRLAPVPAEPLWSEPVSSLLYEYSSLQRRYPRPPRATGFE